MDTFAMAYPKVSGLAA